MIVDYILHRFESTSMVKFDEINFELSNEGLKLCWKIKQCLSNALKIFRCFNRSLKNSVAYKTY